MNIQLNLFSLKETINFSQKNFYRFFTDLDKKILVIASIAFGLLAAYLIKHNWCKLNVWKSQANKLHQNDKTPESTKTLLQDISNEASDTKSDEINEVNETIESVDDIQMEELKKSTEEIKKSLEEIDSELKILQ